MKQVNQSLAEVLPPETAAFYRRVMTILTDAGLPFLVVGAYAFGYYTGIIRHTKDFDLAIREADLDRALTALREAGYDTDVPFPHWLAKAYHEDAHIDLIFRSGNGLARVDDAWFEGAVDAEILGMPVKVSPPEEIIWTKAFVMERERYDGADIVHLLLRCGAQMNWDRLLELFGAYWPVLFAHLILFQFVYPSRRHLVPARLIDHLMDRYRALLQAPSAHQDVCQGTLISRAQYLIDVDEWGFRDARLAPLGSLTGTDILTWTNDIEEES